MARKSKLSDRQRNILEYIWGYIQEHRRPPTIREIGQAVKISSTSVVNYNLTKLVEKGLLAREAEVSRGLRLTDKAREFLGIVEDSIKGMVRVPMMGDIVASEPLEVGTAGQAGFDEEDALEISSSMLPTGIKMNELSALRVKGDSMIDAMVNEDDIVVMRKQTEARNGDMVAVWITPDDTTTLKYFYDEGEQVRLQPANPTMDPIFVNPANVQVQGKVVMVVRQTA
ncbi:MAG: transcriptional repressor LexA [Anaerolineales bacterium]|nr:transcriptional repressor LexA [Anaerolineales bacterium]